MKRAAAWLMPALYMGLVFYLSSQSHPLPFLPESVWDFDKVLHGTEYAVLGLLLGRAFLAAGLPWPEALLLAAVFASLYGASDEWHQSFVPGRDSDPKDWIADSCGALLGASIPALLRRRRAQASIGA